MKKSSSQPQNATILSLLFLFYFEGEQRPSTSTMVSTITARLSSNRSVASSSVETRHEQKPHATSATKRPLKHRRGNPFSLEECHRREQAEMNYRAATTDQALSKAGRSSCSSSAQTSALPIGIDLSLVQVVSSRDHDALHSPELLTPTSVQTLEDPKNGCHSPSNTQGPVAPSNAPSSELSPKHRSSGSDCYDIDFYSGLISSTRGYYDFGGAKTSPTQNNSQPEPTDSVPSADRRRAPGSKPTYNEAVGSIRPRSSSGSHSDHSAQSTWTASMPTTNNKTSSSLDSDNASDTSSSGASSAGVSSDSGESEDEMSREEKPSSGGYLAVVG